MYATMFIPFLALSQAVLSATQLSTYTPVPYQQAPSHYPGGPWTFPVPNGRRRVCRVLAAPNEEDSVPSIKEAFRRCGRDSKVVFNNDTYHIKSVMDISDLSNVEVEIKGTLLWDTNIDYWLANSMPMGYQNQSTAFRFGGDRVHMYGNGVGTFNGNGQVWYDEYGGISNFARRPHQITFDGLTNSVIEGINFLQPQMWTMTLIHSSKVLLQDIYINSTNFNGGPNLNTDGADTIYASDITFTRWVVDNGDDNIAFKANSTNILVEDCTFHHSTGLAFGSIGQFANEFEVLESITARRIHAVNNKYGAYVKTWTGVRQGTPPNGGGGGLGYLRNVTLEDFEIVGAEQALYVTQCNSYSGFTGECDTSLFEIGEMSFTGLRGDLKSDVVASVQCSGAAPCEGLEVSDVNLTVNGGGEADRYLCSHVVDPEGFECNGTPPNGS